MKIAISSSAPDIQATVDSRFGRCSHFILINQDENIDTPLDWTAIENSALSSSGGAGIKASELIASHDVQCVISGDFGPNAVKTLQAAEIKAYLFNDECKNVMDAFRQYQTGNLLSK